MKSRSIAICTLAIFVAGIIFSAGTASAWEQGHIKIVPGFKSVSKWDSNVFLDSSNERDDFIFVNTPSIVGEFGFGAGGKHKLIADYKVDLGAFSKYDDQNYGNHDFVGEVKLDFNDYTLDVSDRFQFTSDRAGTEFTRRTLRKINTVETVLGVDLNKVSFDFGYSNYMVDYLSNTLRALDRYENSIWATGYVQVMPKTKALLEYKYRHIDYRNATGRDGNAHAIMAGVEGELTPKVTGIIKAGYKFKEYINSARDNFSNAVVYASLDYNPTDRFNALLFYERDGFESTYAGNNFYTGDHLELDLTYKFGKKFVGKANGGYSYNDYPEVGTGATVRREDHIWNAGTGLDYHVAEWMICGVGYDYTQRQSNINNRDYKQHVLMTDVTLTF